MDITDLRRKYIGQSGGNTDTAVRSPRAESAPIGEKAPEDTPRTNMTASLSGKRRPAPEVHAPEVPISPPPSRQPAEPATSRAHEQPPVHEPEAPAEPPRSDPPPTPNSDSYTESDGHFGSDTPRRPSGSWWQRTREGTTPRPRRRGARRFSMQNLAMLPWVDIIMILLTAAGIIEVVIKFDEVTEFLFMGICRIMQSLLWIVLLILAIAVLVLFVTRRRRIF